MASVAGSLLTLTVIVLILEVFACAQRGLSNPLSRENKRNDLAQIEELIVQLLKVKDRLAPSVEYDKQESDDVEYDNEWAVEVIGDEKEAKKIAKTFGYTYVGRVRGFDKTYVFRKDGHRHKRAAEELTRALRSNYRVVWAEQQSRKKRQKRGDSHNDLFNDPLWPLQWQLHDSRNVSDDLRTDMNVIGAWELGYTGKGVVVTILDDGVQRNHTDLVASYDPQASYDLNDNDPDPMPTFDELNRHGTRCAGEVAMAPNNSFCGVGIAYGASIGGVRMLDGKITDRVEAEALSFNYNHIDIYSASWGPNDDGKTVEGPGRLAQAAILKGIRLGRNGKGAIYVWASGNGGLKDDDCDCDGYTDSVYTFSVSSAAEDGTFPWYGEKCASTLTSTYSTGSSNKRMIMTTDIGNRCAVDHSGTSASAPMAAGIIALALEAKYHIGYAKPSESQIFSPSLTWRDVQHIAVWTAEPEPLLRNNEGWVRNAAGLYVNSRSISDTSGAIINFRTDACAGQINEVNYLEHVQLVLDIVYPIRGHLSIFVVSPQGTRTQLLKVRREDKSPAGFRHWPFMSVHTWAENPKGIWQLEVDDKSGRTQGINGIINNITLVIYGTTEQPAHYEAPSRRDMRDDYVTNNRKNVDDWWLQRAKRLINDRSLQRADRVNMAMRYLDAINQRRKRSTLQPYTVSEFVSR